MLLGRESGGIAAWFGVCGDGGVIVSFWRSAHFMPRVRIDIFKGGGQAAQPMVTGQVWSIRSQYQTCVKPVAQPTTPQ